MTITGEANDLVLAANPEPKRDRWGRYLLPHPTTGKQQAWTRATTFASSIADTFALTKWQCRMTALGFGQRPDLLAQVQGITDPDDPDVKQRLGRLCDDAQEHAGSRSAANLGTALHTFAEHVDTGRRSIDETPEQWRPHIVAYRTAMDQAGLVCVPEHVERIVCVPDLGVVGTLDRIIGTRIGDLKTGRDLSYAWGEIAIQLALYAHAEWMWDWQADGWAPMPQVDAERALIMHLPAVAPDPTCTLYEVDIATAWDVAVPLAAGVRDWRKRKGLAKQLATVAAPEPESADAERVAWALDRGRKLMSDPSARQIIADSWPDGVARPSGAADWTAADLAAVCAVLDTVEGLVGAPFPEPDPATPPIETPTIPPPLVDLPAIEGGDGQPADPAALAAAAEDAMTLPGERMTLVGPWKVDARRQGRPWPAASVERGYATNVAAAACLRHLWDDDDPEALIRAALSVAIGTDVRPSWTTGGLLGSLTTAQANRLAQIASSFPQDSEVAADLGRRCVA